MKTIRRSISLLLCLLMILSLLPAAMGAEETAPKENAGEEPTVEESDAEEPTEEEYTPDFVKYGLDARLKEIGGTYTYHTAGFTGKKADKDHAAKAKVTSYWAFFYPKGETFDWLKLPENVYSPGARNAYLLEMSKTQVEWVREIEKMAGDGYEWRGIALEFNFTSYKHGWYYGTCVEDFYDIMGHDKSSETLNQHSGKTTSRYINKYTVQYNGEEVTYYSYRITKTHSNSRVMAYMFFYAPKGYDGCVFGTYDVRKAPKGWKDGKYVFDYQNKYMLLFRAD